MLEPDPNEIARRLAALEQRLTAIEHRLALNAPSLLPGMASPDPSHPLSNAAADILDGQPASFLTEPGPQRAQPGPSTRTEAPRPAEGIPSSRSPAGARDSVESVIGAHWLNRVGIAALIVGVAFFLKYAFDNQWVGPGARVLTGLAAGVALLAWSERFLARGLVLFSHTLTIVAVGILYLAIWAASQLYALVGNAAAFTGTALLTAFLVSLAVRHRSEFIAGIALSCGLLAPVLLSTGTNRELELFTYVALLDSAALVLITLHPWIRALSVAFLGTLFLFVGWFSSYYSEAQIGPTVSFASLFFLLFATVPLLRKWDSRGLASTAIVLLPFANAFVYFGQLADILHDSHHLARLAVALAGFHCALALALRIRGPERDDLTAVHVALALGFITVAVPLWLDQLWVTMGWLVEGSALLALALATPVAATVFRRLGSFALFLGVFRLLFLDVFTPGRPLLNMRALTYGLAVATFTGITIVTARRRTSTRIWRLAIVVANTLALIELTAEVSDFFNHFGGASVESRSIARDFGWSALWMCYGTALMGAGFRRRQPFLRWLALVLIGVTAAKVFFYDLSELSRIYRILSFLGLGVMLLAISFAYQRKWLAGDRGGDPPPVA